MLKSRSNEELKNNISCGKLIPVRWNLILLCCQLKFETEPTALDIDKYDASHLVQWTDEKWKVVQPLSIKYIK